MLSRRSVLSQLERAAVAGGFIRRSMQMSSTVTNRHHEKQKETSERPLSLFGDSWTVQGNLAPICLLNAGVDLI